ncbi:Acetylxylan esterase precursor [Caulifigura coniformis]|uniref:Acetylxylan esterase n=1 Tax=Caulifigura coniformis TaxID=2527983 RepID=A0A517S967_9PLAN|nr:alpha/beta hydrolase [Caulifigura coniformis]QDT52677.1 Acetylxylan esterase precursor [Caulifigura coniformis]
MKHCLALVVMLVSAAAGAAEPQVRALWPAEVPGPLPIVDGDERDLTKDTDRPIAGRRIIKLGHVRTPQMHVYLPAKDKANGAAVVIAPGGGFSILAWDLEGTEVAEWLNSLGYAAVVLKYRVPTRTHGETLDATHPVPLVSLGPVMDAQRALSLTRSHAAEWNIDPGRIGILGFSAGGNIAGLTACLTGERVYGPVDDADKAGCEANFAILVYPARLVDETSGQLKPHVKVSEKTPPMFFVMTQDDRVGCENCTALFTALTRAKVPAEIHVFTHGGHGYGLRPTEKPVTHWSEDAAAWMKAMGFDDARMKE